MSVLCVFLLVVLWPAVPCLADEPSDGTPHEDAQAEPVRIVVSVEPAVATIGDRLHLRIDVDRANGVAVAFPDVVTGVAPFEVLDAVIAESAPGSERTVERRDYIIAAFETVAFHDLSLLIKMGVQFGLFGGSILQLGTERHHQKYLRDVGTLDLPGCFAMTETGHGSNVHELGTVARYDAQTEEFVVHTPHESARKDYIGNAAQHGRLATVFAQLEVGEERHGVHALLVPIRDEDGSPCAGVRIEACGES